MTTFLSRGLCAYSAHFTAYFFIQTRAIDRCSSCIQYAHLPFKGAYKHRGCSAHNLARFLKRSPVRTFALCASLSTVILLREMPDEKAMHSVICIARRKYPLRTSSSVRETSHDEDAKDSNHVLAGSNNGSAPDDAEIVQGRGLAEDVAEALLRRKKNLEQLVSVLTRAMDLHQAVAPLQWICLVCLIDLHALETRVSDMFMIRSGCQILHRCVRHRTSLPFPSAVFLKCSSWVSQERASLTSCSFFERVRAVLEWRQVPIDTDHRRCLNALGFALAANKVHSYQLTAHGGDGAGLQGGGSLKRA